MTLAQGLAFSIVGTMMALFVWGRLRYDLVALLALFAGVLAGIVPAKEAFSGFSDDIVIIVACALLVSAAIAKSGITEQLMRPLMPYLTSTQVQVIVLTTIVALLSTFIKNVGALAILMPVALQLAKRSNSSPSQLLMPLAFGSLLGGMITLIGTSPNIIASRLRQEIVGQPFSMFDFAPVGLTLTAAGLLCLAFTYWLLPKDRKSGVSIDAAIDIESYVSELRVPPQSMLVGKTVAELDALGEGDTSLTTIVRGARRIRSSDRMRLQAGDVLLVEGETDAIERLVVRGGLELETKSKEISEGERDADDFGAVEGVVTGDSILVGQTPIGLDLRDRYQVNVLAISRRGQRITKRFRSVRFRPGDVVLMQGRFEILPDALKALGILPLAERALNLGRGRNRFIPALILIGAMLTIVFNIFPVAIAFFGASLALLLTRTLSLREAYESIEWPILVLLGALIPVSEAVRTTGGTDLIASWLSVAANALPAMGALALILIAAMAVTPFLNNAATVLVMAPIAASLARNLGLNPDPFLMAVAVGAACDFLTPFGHQCNTLVMGPGGYRFNDYWRLGLPLSLVIVGVGIPTIALFWPLVRG